MVRHLKVEGGTLFIEGVDILDGTPLLDIKPFVPDLDVREVERTGWLSHKANAAPGTKADDRFGSGG